MAYLLTVGGAVGLLASMILSVDKLNLLKNPHLQLNCDLNPVVSCGSVMQSAQASIAGIPNSFFGIATFAALMAIGAGMLAGATYKRWFWLALEGGMLAGLVFALWLFFQSMYRIKALCPYCLTTDVVVITLLWYNSLFLLEQGHIKVKGAWATAANFARRHHLDILVVIFLVMIAEILHNFWYYYGQFFS